MAYSNSRRHENPFAKQLAALDGSLQLFGKTLASNIMDDALGFESLSKDTQDSFMLTEDSVRQELVTAGVAQTLHDTLGLPGEEVNLEHPNIKAGLDAAVMTYMAAQAPEKYHQSYFEKKTGLPAVEATFSEGLELGAETFDKPEFGDFLSTSLMSNALAAATNPFSEAFFRTVVVPPSQAGLEMSVQVPTVQRRTPRGKDGKAFNHVRTPINRCLVDHKILENNATDVYPIVPADNSRDAVLVSAADVPNIVKRIAGIDQNVRPIKIGVEVDLIGLSQTPEMLAQRVMNETDTLASAVSMGELFVKVTNGTDVSSVALPVDGMPGALLRQAVEGNVADSNGNFQGKVLLTHDALLPNGTTVDATLKLGAKLGLAAGTAYAVEILLEATARLDDIANFKLQYMEAKFGTVFVGPKRTAMAKTDAAYTTFVADVALAPLGIIPKAVRSNTNMAEIGTIVDAGKELKYRLAIMPESPFTTVSPVTVPGGAASMDTLSLVKRARDGNRAVTKIFEIEKQLKMTKGIQDSSASIGGQVVKPTHLESSFDATKHVVIEHSAEGLLSMRSALATAVTLLANDLIMQSEYLSALEMMTGSQSNFEVIVGTDPNIAAHLLMDGDSRTLGNNRKFTVVSTLDERMLGKVFITLRRTDVDGADALSFGVHGVMPSLIFSAQTNRTAEVARETISIPRSAWHVTLPVLARLDVTGIEAFASIPARP